MSESAASKKPSRRPRTKAESARMNRDSPWRRGPHVSTPANAARFRRMHEEEQI